MAYLDKKGAIKEPMLTIPKSFKTFKKYVSKKNTSEVSHICASNWQSTCKVQQMYACAAFW